MVQAHGASAAGSGTEMKKTGVLLLLLLSAGSCLHGETRQTLIASVPCPQALWVTCVLLP